MTATADAILAPFLESRATRQAYQDRTRALLGASTANEPSLLTLANINTSTNGKDERRPTSTFLIRPPSAKEMQTLLDPNGCNCRLSNDKVQIKVMYRVAGNGEGSSMRNWDLSSSLKQQVKNNCFGGDWIILGVLLDGPDAVSTEAESSLASLAGISNNSLLQNSILEPGSAIHNNSEISNTHIMKYASILGCGSVSCPKSIVEKSAKKCNFDMKEGSMDIEVGPEAGGGRVVNVKIESTLVDVCHDLNMDSGSGGKTIAPLVPSSGGKNANSGEMQMLAMNILSPHSTIQHTPQTTHVHLLPHSSISSATSVTSSILLPHSTIAKGCTVSHALLQWSATLTSQSDAHFVFLMEKSEVGPHSFTANAIYGPDSHVSGGEVHCTVFGPNANSHHQSLLIGILWPLGRGNVGYGSNVGSNHTGRIPDQETSVGEGTFWGLGSVIKFPVDLTSAPYSIIAAGVQLQPQRITLPFSLITDGPGGMNLLTPGWLLQYSPYTIARSEVKFANRRTAKRHDFYTGWKILRAGVMDMLVNARDSLVYAGQQQQQQQQSGGETSGSNSKKVFKTDRSIPGLGANQLTEKGRQIGIRAYTAAIQRYALRGLLDRLVTLTKSQSGKVSLEDVLRHVGLEGVNGASASDVTAPTKSKVNWPVLPWNEESHADAEALWKHQHSMLMNELPSIVAGGKQGSSNVLAALLQKCIALEEDHAKRVYQSKSRDDSRGAKTVPGYKDVHVAAEKDSVVLAAKEEAEQVKAAVQLIENAVGGVRSRL